MITRLSPYINKKILPISKTYCLRYNHTNSQNTNSQNTNSQYTNSQYTNSQYTNSQYTNLSDNELLEKYKNGKLPFFNIEKELGDFERAVRIRRIIVEKRMGRSDALHSLPFQNYDYHKIHNQCCENVIGYVQVPVGVAGPILVNGKEHYLPMATTEGALVASTSRGAKAIVESGGCVTEICRDGMTRAPVFACKSVKEAYNIQKLCEDKFDDIAAEFNSTSNYARLQSIKTNIVGKYIFLRFKCTTGDAMGMNMACKGTDKSIEYILQHIPARLISLSGNVCTDKKPSAINWIEGRGKSVVCEAVIKKDVVEKILKTSVDAMIELNYVKNMIGSSVAGSIGGNNAHASNIVTAMFIACGQDVAQNVESSNCITTMEKDTHNEEDLYVSVTLPSLEVGTVGGGTNLSSQSACLKLLGVLGADDGNNANKLASIIASGVLAGEISLIAALSSGHLLSSHMKLNRKQKENNSNV